MAARRLPFADIVGFTALSDRLSPTEMVELLNEVFSHFDGLVEQFNLEKIRTIGDNYMVVSGAPCQRQDHARVLKEIPRSPQQSEEIKTAALRNPFVADNLLSDSGMAMAVNIYVKAHDGQPDFDARVSQGIERVLRSLDGKLQTHFQLGSPYVRAQIQKNIRADQANIVPLAIVVLFATLALTLKSLGGVVIPFLTAGLSVVRTLGLMAAFDIPVTVMTAIVPVLLVIVGSTEDIHLIAEYQAGVRRGMPRPEAIRHMAFTMGTAVLLTFITTYLGFLSIALNEVELLRQFGWVASTGLLLNFLLTILLVPIGLGYLGARNTGVAGVTPKAAQGREAEGILRLILAHRRSVILAGAAATLACLYGAFSLRVSNAPLDYFDRDSTVIQRLNILEKSFAGKETFSIVLSSGIEGTFLKRRYLDELRKLQDHLAGTGHIGKSLSFADYIALVHNAMEERDTEEFVLPEEGDIIREYMNIIGHERVRAFVSRDFSEARILVRHGMGDSWELGQALEGNRGFMDANIDPGLTTHITGETVLINRAADAMANAQAQSLGLMILVIFSIIALLFVNTKAGLVAIVPNLFPIAVLFGVMGFGGIALDTGTAMIAAISLGI